MTSEQVKADIKRITQSRPDDYYRSRLQEAIGSNGQLSHRLDLADKRIAQLEDDLAGTRQAYDILKATLESVKEHRDMLAERVRELVAERDHE
jgi:cell division protein FtsB